MREKRWQVANDYSAKILNGKNDRIRKYLRIFTVYANIFVYGHFYHLLVAAKQYRDNWIVDENRWLFSITHVWNHMILIIVLARFHEPPLKVPWTSTVVKSAGRERFYEPRVNELAADRGEIAGRERFHEPPLNAMACGGRRPWWDMRGEICGPRKVPWTSKVQLAKSASWNHRVFRVNHRLMLQVIDLLQDK